MLPRLCTLVLLLLVGIVDPVTAQDAVDLPQQVLFLPLGTGVDPEDRGAPVSLTFRDIELPDARRAQWIRLSWWVRLTPRQSVELALDYVGLESRELMRYGGGRAEVQWSARPGALFTRPIGIDAALVLPTGDASLHPLSAKFPAVRGRLRAALLDFGSLKLWTGAWGQLVSPPSRDVRQDPLASFPSGWGVDAALEARAGGWRLAASARRPFADLPEAFSFALDVDRFFTPELALRLGGMLDIGPRLERSLDHGWTAGLVWRPEVDVEPEGRRLE